MNIKTTYWAKPGPSRHFDWEAYDDDTYDGADDSKTRHQIGFGPTRRSAIKDLIDILKQDAKEKGK